QGWHEWPGALQVDDRIGRVGRLKRRGQRDVVSAGRRIRRDRERRRAGETGVVGGRSCGVEGDGRAVRPGQATNSAGLLEDAVVGRIPGPARTLVDGPRTATVGD